MKIFGLGFHKTGTTSLSYALKTLGYKVGRGLKAETYLKPLSQHKLSVLNKVAKKYDVLQDIPWPLYYEYVDTTFPQSKFILTLRDKETWINSFQNYFNSSKQVEWRDFIYGKNKGYITPERIEDYLKRYDDHNKAVQHYFKDRPNDLLVLNIEGGDGWKSLCAFLGKPIPSIPFPHWTKVNQKRWRNLKN